MIGKGQIKIGKGSGTADKILCLSKYVALVSLEKEKLVFFSQLRQPNLSFTEKKKKKC